MEHYEEHVYPTPQPGQDVKACATEAQSTDAKAESNAEDDLTDRNAPWRAELRKAMNAKERKAIERVVMPELDPEYRAKTRLEEVNRRNSAKADAST